MDLSRKLPYEGQSSLIALGFDYVCMSQLWDYGSKKTLFTRETWGWILPLPWQTSPWNNVQVRKTYCNDFCIKGDFLLYQGHAENGEGTTLTHNSLPIPVDFLYPLQFTLASAANTQTPKSDSQTLNEIYLMRYMKYIYDMRYILKCSKIRSLRNYHLQAVGDKIAEMTQLGVLGTANAVWAGKSPRVVRCFLLCKNTRTGIKRDSIYICWTRQD